MNSPQLQENNHLCQGTEGKYNLDIQGPSENQENWNILENRRMSTIGDSRREIDEDFQLVGIITKHLILVTVEGTE